ncbi:MAG: YggS family pyridoxal phosphate-dependent enzyme [Planctomycetota bacterium]
MNADVLKRNLDNVRERMACACARAGRDPAGVRLVAVTKTVTADVAEQLVELGVTDIGENRIQEAARKQQRLAHLDLNWHMIGHLQTNKVTDALRLFGLIHSVDSLHLAKALSKRASSQDLVAPILVQIDIAGEETKYGVPAADAAVEIGQMAELRGLRIEGLMTMAPFVDDAETVRPVFARLRELAAEIDALALPGVGMKHLSMGMTQDFEVAIEEGATLIRVGSALTSVPGTEQGRKC